MRQFKVIALSCSGKGKKIYNSGDVVQESGFPEGTADELVEKGFIKEIEFEPINDEPEAEPEAENPSKTDKKADKKKK